MNAAALARRAVTLASTALLLAALPVGAAQINILNLDGAGEGLNDPTVVAPVGGNPGTTRGQQILNVYNAAAAFWGNLIESDAVINIEGQVNPLTCTTTGATLASAGALFILRDFPNQDFAASWYAMALANKLTGTDNDPAGNDLAFRANTTIVNGPTAGCPFKFYLGLDGNTPPTEIDLFTVMLHEVAHGLGFANFVNESTGANTAAFTDVYSQFTRDNTLGQTWAQINPTSGNEAAISASALRCDQIAWSGQYVTAEVPNRLQFGLPSVAVAAGPAAGVYPVGTASTIGSPLTNPGVTGTVVQALDPADAAGPTTFDGCSPLTNAAAVAGNIAIIDRGTCGFAVKYLNAINAGATAVIIADNAAGCPPGGLGGAQAGAAPIVRVTLPDGALLKANLPLTATVGLNPSARAGADPANRAKLAALNPVALGSSISHFDASHLPNSLMEPAINSDLAPEIDDVDLTFELFQDIGWFKADRSLTAADSADPVQYGASFNYVVTATNGGSGSDKPFALTITPPAGFTVGSGVGTGWTCTGTAPVSCTRNAVAGPDLPTGVQPAITLALVASVPPGVYGGSATIPTPLPLLDPVLANNSAAVSTTVVSPASLAGATKTVAGVFQVGQTVTYTVTIPNAGPNQQFDNPGNEFTDVLPAQLTLVSASATSGTAVATVATNTVTWNGAIPAAGAVTVTLTATIDAGTELQVVSNQGQLAWDADGNGSNEAGGSTDDPAAPGAADPTTFTVVSPANLSGATKSVAGTYESGGAIIYTIVLTNSGAATQLDNPGDELVDVLPPELELVGAAASSGVASADLGTNTVTWNGSIPAGGSVTITIDAVLLESSYGVAVANQATVAWDADGNGTNEASGGTDDPSTSTPGDPTSFFVGATLSDIPTLGPAGLALLALALAAAAIWLARRRRTAV
jgi:uncharacterized repeat protein (TIGR01451 family)